MASSTACLAANGCPSDETYVQREGTENVGAEYEYLIPTLFAIRCIFRDNIKNIWLGCNVKGLGAFDDVFLNIQYSNGKKCLYVIQLKHVKGPIKVSSFTDVKDKNFNFDKYYKSFQEIEATCGTSDHILHNVKLDDIIFFIYTTANLIKPEDTVGIPKLNFNLKNVVKFDENQLFNTTVTRKGHIYKFQPEEPNASSVNATFLSNFYLLLNQSNNTAVQQFIYEEINAKFDNVDDNVKANFMHYIKIMTIGSKPYQLQKHDLQGKLIELILTPYIVEPNNSMQMKNIDLWNEVVDGTDIVVFQHDTIDVVAKIWTIINEKIKKHLNKTIPDSSEWLKPTDKETKTEFFNKYKKQYLESLLKKQVGPNGNITLKSLYILLWKAELVPLFLRADNLAQQANIAKAIKLIKATKNKKHFIVLDKENLENKHVKNLKVFRNVADLSEEKVAMLEMVKVNFQGRKNDITLNKIIDLNQNIKTTISTELLLEFVHGTVTIGNKLAQELDYAIERSLIKSAIHVSAIQKLKGSIFVIWGAKKVIDNLKPSLESFFDSDSPCNLGVKNTICSGTENVVLTSTVDTTIFQEICNLVPEKNIHKLCIREETQIYLEWLDSKGSIEELQPFIVHHDKFCLSDNDLLNRVTHRTNIISANPGMGKSVLINKLAVNYPSNFWVIIFNISDHIQNVSETNFFDYFYNNNESKISPLQEFTKSVFSTLVKLKQVCVFVDGCDEVLGMHLDNVSHLLTYLHREGFHLWIAGRPIARQHLESLFNIFSVNLNPFTAADQKSFLKKYYSSKHKNEDNLQQFSEKIQGLISNSFSNWKENFAGVPLRIRMMAELSLNENPEIFDEFDLISLYEHFIDNKLNIYWKKLYGNSPNAQLQARIKKDNRKLKIQHMNVALTLFYSQELLETVLDYDDLEEFLEDIKTGTENVGIITGIGENLEPTFEHRSFAEYLTARWLAERCKNKKSSEFLSRIFEQDSREVRQFFDRMLTTNCPLHAAFLNCDMEKNMEKLLSDPETLQLVDEGGRTALHLVASWSTRHIFPTNSIENFAYLNTQEHYIEEPLFSDCKKILQKLLTDKTLLFRKDKLMGWSALDYADKTYCLDAIDEMWMHFHRTNSENLNVFNQAASLLYYCAKYAYINIFKVITEHPIIFNEVNQTLIHTATQNGNRNILKCMLEEYRQTYVNFINEKDRYERTPLYYACQGPTIHKQPSGSNNHAHYIDCVQILINENAEINVTDENGYIALHAAAEYGNIDILKMLIQSGSNIDHASQNGSTPLHAAVYKNHTKCILELANADLNARNIYGQTAISFAAILGHTETLQVLLKLKADFNKCDDSDATPLLLAVIKQHVACVKVLVSEGADVNSCNAGSLSPVYVAAKVGNKEILKILIKAKADVNQGRKMSTPLHVAACGGHLDCVRLLISNGAKVNVQNSEGSTPLHECAREGDVNTLKFLIKSRAIINSVTSSGNAPLHLAVEMGHLDNVHQLIKNKADINITTNNGGTPLNIAAHRGHLNIMELLIAAKAIINLPTASDTALHLACFSGQIECIHKLVGKGAIVNVRNNTGITPLHIAAKEGHSETIDILIKANKEQQLKNFDKKATDSLVSSMFIDQLTNFGASPLALAISDAQIECVRRLILNGANINARDNENCTPLFSAVSHGYFNVVKLLLDSGAAVNEENVAVLAPLGAAVLGNRIDIVKLLMEHKANVNVKLDSGLTLLHYAVYRGYFDIVKYLVFNGANPTKKNINGKTPLDLAIDMYTLDNEISYFLEQNVNKLS